jgi:hypothetical protein
VRLCMFHPVDHPLERGWVGRVDDEHVTQLAAQTLQSFFTGGGSAREHAAYPLDGVRLLAPVLHPPSIRVFDDQETFAFANPAAVCPPGASVPSGAEPRGLALLSRLVGVVGAEGAISGFTLLGEWRRLGVAPPKDRDFSLVLGPLVITPDEVEPDGLEVVVRVDGEERLRAHADEFDWEAARELAARGTRLYPGDLLAGPALDGVEVEPGRDAAIDVSAIGALTQSVSRD